ncbi:DUF86 domain-containing protein [Lentibacillus saliphilus]|uniref:DUF86 domain-containing protein n=1 Tax=Lentibacillus saliphilus TaxID=2737028 RepID=UPI001C2FFEBB|nr:DUF86 domain-containing protein [Lentibacillus saliphilus]
MYFVERKKIDDLLEYIDSLLVLFDRGKAFETEIDQLALERLTQMLIESMLDVGNMMIDGFIMRDPGSYHDIIHIMVDEGVLPEADKDGYIAVIDLRKMVVQDYVTIDHELIFQVLAKYRQRLGTFSTYIKTYLNNELGVANAFTKT